MTNKELIEILELKSKMYRELVNNKSLSPKQRQFNLGHVVAFQDIIKLLEG